MRSPAEEPVVRMADQLPGQLGDQGLQSQTLESLADARNYHVWLASLARPYLGDDPIELGSGLGDYAERWLADGLPRITVTDIDPPRLALLTEKFADDLRVTVQGIDILGRPAGNHSSLVAFNVLEHIEDHIGALRAAHTLVRPGGTVVMLVPAFQFAMGRFDRMVGHVRRYTVKSLATAMTDAGLRVEKAHYLNMPGLAAWFVGMRLFRMTPGDGPLVRVWDNYVIPVARRLEDGRRPPFGQSVFAVARVPGPGPAEGEQGAAPKWPTDPA